MDTREAFVNVLLEIHLNQQSLETCKKTNKTNKTLQTPTKRKANQAETRFSAFHWITVCFLVKSSLWFDPNFALLVITYHITYYIRMSPERHFPYEKIVLNDGFPSNTVVGVLLRKSMTLKHFLLSPFLYFWNHLYFYLMCSFLFFHCFLLSFFSCIFSYLLFVVFIYCSF